MMVSLVKILSILLLISTIVNTQNVLPTVPFLVPFQSSFNVPKSLQFPSSLTSTPHLTNKLGRIGLFSDAFYKIVQRSPQLLQVFDVSYPSHEACTNIFQTCNNSLSLAGVAYSESLSKAVADALYLTFPFMTQKDFIYTISDSVATYLITQTKLNLDQPPSYAADFANAMLNSYPGDNEPVNHYTLIRSFSHGVVAFLKSKDAYPLDRAPALSLELAKHFFAMSIIRQPSIEVTVVAPPYTIPSAFDVFGITGFADSFITAVDSSPLLQSLFYVDQPGTIVGKAWNNAITEFCIFIKCYFPKGVANVIDEAMLQTYDYMSKRTFTLCVARAHALTLFATGKLLPGNAAKDAGTLITEIQNNLSQLQPNAELQSRVRAYLNTFQSQFKDNADLVNEFSIHIYHIGNEMFAESFTKKPRYS